MAVVLIAATSEPPPGSVMASAEIFFPLKTWGAISRCSSFEPCLTMMGKPMLCENRLACTPPLAPCRAMPSDTMLRMRWLAGVPPNSSG